MCYEKFGWKPEDISNIPDSEALRLSIVFEEQSRYEYKQNQKMKNQSHDDYQTVEELPAE